MSTTLIDESTGEEIIAEFFGLRGEPITLKQWIKLFTNSRGMTDEVNGYTIMTRWVGVDTPSPEDIVREFSYKQWTPNEPPLIYRTTVIDLDERVVECVQYSTKEEAIEGHQALINKYKETE